VRQTLQRVVEAKPQRAERFYLPELDVLRFFAFFAVFIHHLPIPFEPNFYYDKPGVVSTVGRAGAFGVDLFFTLSGYLITRLLLREKDETGDINLKAFYARRTLRIWPLYYFSIGLAFLLTQLPASLTSAPQLAQGVFLPMRPIGYLFMATFLYNFNFAGSLISFPRPFMDILWSVSVEEQFYLFWPWFARFVSRGRIIIVPIIMIAVACVTRATVTFGLSRLLWNYTFARLDPIAVGILIALLPPLNPGRVLRLLLVLVGIECWAFAAARCGLPWSFAKPNTLIGYPAIALGSGAFVLATLGTKSLRKDSALVKSVVYLGKISYGLYVYSTMAYSAGALFVFKVLAPESSRSWTTLSLYVVVTFAFNLAIAAASYRCLEAPFLRLKERFTRIPTRAV
jgi:peptidoglycan/LPS O-acetylase OafA/YrhL